MKSLAVFFLVTGVLLFAAGLLFLFADKITWLGNLPGDIQFKFRNVRIHFPLMSCIFISVILTIVLNIILRILGK